MKISYDVWDFFYTLEPQYSIELLFYYEMFTRQIKAP